MHPSNNSNFRGILLWVFLNGLEFFRLIQQNKQYNIVGYSGMTYNQLYGNFTYEYESKIEGIAIFNNDHSLTKFLTNSMLSTSFRTESIGVSIMNGTLLNFL